MKLKLPVIHPLFILVPIICLVSCSADKENLPQKEEPPTPTKAGALFTAVKSVITNNCLSCHSATNPAGGLNLADDAIVVNKAARIKARAVDGTPSFMPPNGMQLSQVDKDKITSWIAAGGKYTD